MKMHNDGKQSELSSFQQTLNKINCLIFTDDQNDRDRNNSIIAPESMLINTDQPTIRTSRLGN